MKITELINEARTNFLDDVNIPLIWSDVYLAKCGTEAEREACRRSHLIFDSSTQFASTLASGTTTATTTNKLVDSGAAFTSTVLNKIVYNTTNNTWATITAVDSGTTLSLSRNIFISGNGYKIGAASDAIARVAVSSGTAKYTLSNKVLKIKNCWFQSTGNPLSQKTEGWLDRNYYQWRLAKGSPVYYMEEKGAITLIPEPDASINGNAAIDTLNLTVSRLPLADLILATDNSPEIPEEYHFDLIHWICHLAYNKQDADAKDLRMALWHERKFAEKFGNAVSATMETLTRKIPVDFKLETPTFGL